MGDIKTLEQLSLISAFLVPGLVAAYIRSRFLTGRVDLSKEGMLVFFTISLIWSGLTVPILSWIGNTQLSLGLRSLVWLLWAIVGPAILGLMLGVDARHGWFRWLLGKVRIPTVHPIPSAWDWKFGGVGRSWVIVTLKNDHKIYGLLGEKSFFSSDPKERDVYIEQVWTVDKKNRWTRNEQWSVLIPHGEIRVVEFMPDIEGGSK